MIELSDLDTTDDPRELFQLASEAIHERQKAINELGQLRRKAVNQLRAEGKKYDEIAVLLGISPARISQLIHSVKRA